MHSFNFKEVAHQLFDPLPEGSNWNDASVPTPDYFDYSVNLKVMVTPWL